MARQSGRLPRRRVLDSLPPGPRHSGAADGRRDLFHPRPVADARRLAALCRFLQRAFAGLFRDPRRIHPGRAQPRPVLRLGFAGAQRRYRRDLPDPFAQTMPAGFPVPPSRAAGVHHVRTSGGDPPGYVRTFAVQPRVVAAASRDRAEEHPAGRGIFQPGLVLFCPGVSDDPRHGRGVRPAVRSKKGRPHFRLSRADGRRPRCDRRVRLRPRSGPLRADREVGLSRPGLADARPHDQAAGAGH